MLLFLFFLVAESTLLGSLVPSNTTLPTKDLMKQIMTDPKKLLEVDDETTKKIETSQGQEQDLVNKVDDETTKTLQSAESTLLGSLVPSNATLPTKDLMKQIMADPKKFVAEVSKVDPGELQNIITLLEGLLETSEGQEQDLVNKVDDETTKTLQSAEVLANAQADVEDAQAAVEDAQAAVEAAQAALSLKEQEHQAASDAHDAQEGAKAVAEQELADLEGGLNSEQEVIRQVIEMLQGLQGGSLPECENCVELDGRQFATMDFCPPDTPYSDPACDTCQRDYLPLPDGWQLASSADTSAIAANHIFDTHVIVAANGDGWQVKTYGSQIQHDSNVLLIQGDTYKPRYCAVKVLMMREA